MFQNADTKSQEQTARLHAGCRYDHQRLPTQFQANEVEQVEPRSMQRAYDNQALMRAAVEGDFHQISLFLEVKLHSMAPRLRLIFLCLSRLLKVLKPSHVLETQRGRLRCMRQAPTASKIAVSFCWTPLQWWMLEMLMASRRFTWPHSGVICWYVRCFWITRLT